MITNTFTPKMLVPQHIIAEQATAVYQHLLTDFKQNGQTLDFNFKEQCTKWTNKLDAYTHRVHRYPAKLVPYVPFFFLGVEGVGKKDGKLIDPFCGSGTVLIEGIVHPVNSMNTYGFEINPLTRLIAKVKTKKISILLLQSCWTQVQKKYVEFNKSGQLFDFPNKSHWFSPEAEKGIAAVQQAVLEIEDVDAKDFLLVCLSDVVRKVSSADPRVSVPVRLNPDRWHEPAMRQKITGDLEKRNNIDVLEVMRVVYEANLLRISAYILEVEKQNLEAIVAGRDARTLHIEQYESMGNMSPAENSVLEEVDLVLTSPPYMNAQRYTRSLRLELFALGFTQTSHDEGALDRQQVGTERIGFKDYDAHLVETASTSANEIIEHVQKADRYRAAILGKYINDMDTSMKKCFNAMRTGAHAVFVLGNNTIRGNYVPNDVILAELGTKIGFKHELTLRNEIPSRGLMTKRHHTSGVITHEHVVVLKK